MNKFAIFNYSGKATNKGGPAGYLSHLYSGFAANEPEFLYIVEPNSSIGQQGGTGRKNTLSGKCGVFYEVKSIFSYFKKGFIVRQKYRKIINEYDYLHVHDSESVWYLTKFAKFKGKIILTSHRPEPLCDEVLNSIKAKYSGNFRFLRLFLNGIESYSYKRADAFIFPSEHAAGIYEEFPGYSKGKLEKPIKFIITGLNKKEANATKKEYFKLHNIDIDPHKPIVSYIGRHNKIKGYDRVVASFDAIKQNNACVIVAGAPGAIHYPDNEDWVELGYINDAMNLMHISDVIVIPNRNTYFDLVIIEALSMGKIVITSNTGGNLDIAKNCEGLVLFDNNTPNACSKAISSILSMPKEQRGILEKASKSYYEKYCTPQIFAYNYLKAISEIENIL